VRHLNVVYAPLGHRWISNRAVNANGELEMSNWRQNLRIDRLQLAIQKPISRRGLLQSAVALLGTTAASGLVTAPAQVAPAKTAFTHPVLAQSLAQSARQQVSSYIDAQGTAYITRIVPVPQTISTEAQKSLARQATDAAHREAPPQPKKQPRQSRQMSSNEYRSAYPVYIDTSATIAGVPVSVVTPLVIPANKANRVLINLHGGGFTSDSGSLTESIPIANLTQAKVVSVLYRLAPEHPFPAAVEDVVAVYRELLKTFAPQNIAIYGSSAGAVLTPEVAVQIKQLGLPLPDALGIFSGGGDFTRTGDSQSIFGVHGLSGQPDIRPKGVQWLAVYVGSADPQNPVLSPFFADLHGMPPTLFVTSTRDMLLSDTTILHRAFLRAGVDARLVVFEGLNHCFWYDPNLPESREANSIMANFFDAHFGTK
jgi:epsilon-lactone hydrolase